MSPFRYRDEPPYITPKTKRIHFDGAHSTSRSAPLAGFAAGVVVAQHYGGFKGLTDRIKRHARRGGGGEEEERLRLRGIDEDDESIRFDDEDLEPSKARSRRPKSSRSEFSKRFRNDPDPERARDRHRRNRRRNRRADRLGKCRRRIATGGRDRARSARRRDRRQSPRGPNRRRSVRRRSRDRYEDGDPAFTERTLGRPERRNRAPPTGQLDRDRPPRRSAQCARGSLDSERTRAFMAAAEDIPDASSTRRTKAKKTARGGRTDGSAVAPSGVPKARSRRGWRHPGRRSAPSAYNDLVSVTLRGLTRENGAR